MISITQGAIFVGTLFRYPNPMLQLESITEQVQRLQQAQIIYVSPDDVKKLDLKSNVKRGLQDATKKAGRYPMSISEMKKSFGNHISKAPNDIQGLYYDFIGEAGTNEEVEDKASERLLKKRERRVDDNDPLGDVSECPKESKAKSAKGVPKQNAPSAPTIVDDAEPSRSKNEDKRRPENQSPASPKDNSVKVLPIEG